MPLKWTKRLPKNLQAWSYARRSKTPTRGVETPIEDRRKLDKTPEERKSQRKQGDINYVPNLEMEKQDLKSKEP